MLLKKEEKKTAHTIFTKNAINKRVCTTNEQMLGGGAGTISLTWDRMAELEC